MSFGSRLLQARKKKGISQEELATHLGTKGPAIGRYERDEMKPSIDVATKMAKLLQNVQRVLQPVSVRNPYAEQLRIPPEVFKQRRSNAHYLAFIEVVTFYKQYQRERKTDEATGE